MLLTLAPSKTSSCLNIWTNTSNEVLAICHSNTYHSNGAYLGPFVESGEPGGWQEDYGYGEEDGDRFGGLEGGVRLEECTEL
jgi:hypothetical protein